MANDYVQVYNSLLARARVKLLSRQAGRLHKTAAELADAEFADAPSD
jgi:hypothetical protein